MPKNSLHPAGMVDGGHGLDTEEPPRIESVSSVVSDCDPWTEAHQAPLFMGFSRQKYCHSLLLEIFVTQGLNMGLLHCRQILYHLSHQGSLLLRDISKYKDSSVQFSCSVVSDSLRPHESQHARSPCPSPSPGVLSDSCPSNQ